MSTSAHGEYARIRSTVRRAVCTSWHGRVTIDRRKRRNSIRHALGSKRLKIDFILPQPLDVLDARAARHEVVGQIQDVIGLVIREVALEHLDVVVDSLCQAEVPYKLVHLSRSRR